DDVEVQRTWCPTGMPETMSILIGSAQAGAAAAALSTAASNAPLAVRRERVTVFGLAFMVWAFGKRTWWPPGTVEPFHGPAAAIGREREAIAALTRRPQ